MAPYRSNTRKPRRRDLPSRISSKKKSYQTPRKACEKTRLGKIAGRRVSALVNCMKVRNGPGGGGGAFSLDVTRHLHLGKIEGEEVQVQILRGHLETKKGQDGALALSGKSSGLHSCLQTRVADSSYGSKRLRNTSLRSGKRGS